MNYNWYTISYHMPQSVRQMKKERLTKIFLKSLINYFIIPQNRKIWLLVIPLLFIPNVQYNFFPQSLHSNICCLNIKKKKMIHC